MRHIKILLEQSNKNRHQFDAIHKSGFLGFGRSFLVCCLVYRSSTNGLLLLQIFSGNV